MGVDLLAQRARILLSKEVDDVVVAPNPNDLPTARMALHGLDWELGQTGRAVRATVACVNRTVGFDRTS